MHAALLAEFLELKAFLKRFLVLVRLVVHFIAGFAGKSDQVIL